MAKTSELKTYDELMSQITVCRTKEAFDAVSQDHDMSYIGTKSTITRNASDYIEGALKKLGCDLDASKENGDIYSPSYQDVAYLHLALQGLKQNANVMRIVKDKYEAEEQGIIHVEYWYISGE